MRVVLYTKDFEPITVIDLPLWLLDQMEKEGVIRVAVVKQPTTVEELEEVIAGDPETIDIYCTKIYWGDGSVKTILVTEDDELALALRPDWLPGQQAAVNWYQKTIRGLIDQLHKAMKNR